MKKLSVFLSALSLSFCLAAESADVIIYGGTSAGVAAAVQARRMGVRPILIEPTKRLGGLTTGGLGQTDIGRKDAFGGLARQFYRDVKAYYADDANWRNQTRATYVPNGQSAYAPEEDAMWTFEPSAALKILERWITEAGVDVVYGERLDRSVGGVVKKDGRIVSIKMESGKTFKGRMFLDCTYEGDLMAAAGVTYTVGREANAQYGETINGVQRARAVSHQFYPGVDPYVVKGDPTSGLLPGVEMDDDRPDGAADRRVQAYCFRMCLTDDPKNRIPFAKPEGYDEHEYELLFRDYEIKLAHPELVTAHWQMSLPWINSPMPNRKTDTNNRQGLSTDFIGRNWNWAEGSYAEREKIAAAHLKYQRGLMWTLANHPRIPKNVRDEVSRWGTCRDEFADERGDGWQNQLYVREARRLVGEYVMTEHECRGERVVPRPVALAAYGMDSHHVRRYVGKDGFVHNEGDIQDHTDGKGDRIRPYSIDYGAICPKRGEVGNLLVPVCVSASHIAFGSIRMEPVFFALGQVAATAAAQALEDGVAVQDLAYEGLRARLLADGQRIALAPPEAALDDLLPRPQRIARRKGWGFAVVALKNVKIVHGCIEGAPARTADEAYRLEIGRTNVTIVASTEKGVRHARTTLNQLTKLAGGVVLPQCVIEDWPRFPMRGLMLDCGRNFQSLDLLRAVIDQLAAYKHNVFHWHLTEYYGWRLESKVHPELQSPKAFGRQTGKYYTQREFVEFVEYAAQRGVTVIPELDVPGHTLAFRRAFGIPCMNTPGVREIILDLIDELCSLLPPEKMPYVHLGTDEVNLHQKGNPEGVPAEWLAAWAQRVSDRGRILMGWMPGERLKPTGPSIHEYWWFTPSAFFQKFLPEAGSHAYVDSTDMCYINHVDPLALLCGATYTQPCRWGNREDFRMGALISSWHDDRVASDTDMARTNPIFPAIVLFSDAFWRGREKDESGLLARLPPPDDSRLTAAAALEKAIAAQRDRALEFLPWSFPFVKQTHMRWRMTDTATGKVIARKIPQATIYPHHNIFPLNAYVPKYTGGVRLDTWIRSPRDQQVGAWIDFTSFSRTGGRSWGARAPEQGQWNVSGATVTLNGEPIAPPTWDHPGLHGMGAYEVPHTNEDWWHRPPTPIRLKKGWNHVCLDVPAPRHKHNKWVATFTPVLGDTAHPREVPGLEYADEAP